MKVHESKHILKVIQRNLFPRYGWSSLRAFGTNRVVKSAYLWLVLVPIAGKFLSAVNDVADFQILGTQVSVHLSLPFSWKVFFFGALAFSFGNSIWQFCCPEIIRKHSNYSDFINQGRTVLDIKHYFLETMFHFIEPGRAPFQEIQVQEHLKAFLKAATGKRFSMLNEKDLEFFMELSEIPTQNVDRILGYEVAKHKEPDLFHFVVKRSQNLRFFWLKTCTTCYCFGLLLLGINFCQSIWTVIKI